MMEIEKIEELIEEIRGLRVQLADQEMRISMLERLYANPENGLAISVSVASPQLPLKMDENQNIDVIDMLNSPASLSPGDERTKNTPGDDRTKKTPKGSPNLIDF